MQLQLYHRWACPYSKRVRDFIEAERLGERIELVEIGESEGADAKLNDLTGRSQVPCLVIDGKPLLESGEIVAWLGSNIAGRGPASDQA